MVAPCEARCERRAGTTIYLPARGESRAHGKDNEASPKICTRCKNVI
jgi:hypothetical protein